MPALGIDAALVPLAVDETNQLQPPPFGVAGWWRDGPEPGESGPAVIAGHVDSSTGPDTFFGLASAQPGQRIDVQRSDGSSVHFVITEVQRVPRDAFPTDRVYGPSAVPAIRLITCGGEYNRVAGEYADNVIAYGVATT